MSVLALKVFEFLQVLLQPTHCQFYTRGTKIKLTALCTVSSVRFKITIRSWILVSLARSPRERSWQRSLSRVIFSKITKLVSISVVPLSVDGDQSLNIYQMGEGQDHVLFEE